MNTFKKMLNPNGKLLIAVPVGKDAIICASYLWTRSLKDAYERLETTKILSI